MLPFKPFRLGGIKSKGRERQGRTSENLGMTTNKKGVEDFTFYDAESIAMLHGTVKHEK